MHSCMVALRFPAQHMVRSHSSLIVCGCNQWFTWGHSIAGVLLGPEKQGRAAWLIGTWPVWLVSEGCAAAWSYYPLAQSVLGVHICACELLAMLCVAWLSSGRVSLLRSCSHCRRVSLRGTSRITFDWLAGWVELSAPLLYGAAHCVSLHTTALVVCAQGSGLWVAWAVDHAALLVVRCICLAPVLHRCPVYVHCPARRLHSRALKCTHACSCPVAPASAEMHPS